MHSGIHTTTNVKKLTMETSNIYNGQNVSLNGSTDVLVYIDPTINSITNIISIICVIVAMVALGCMMEISKIKTHMKNVKAPAIGIVAQFGIMPMTAFCFAKILQLEPIKAVCVLICGCAPGGTLSNVFVLAVNGDINLSIVMTSFSNTAALGLMPLLLLIYCQGFPGLEKAVPYVKIITALISTVVPCAVGIAINHYKPSFSPYISKFGIFFLMVSILSHFILTFMGFGNVIWTAFSSDIMIIATLMPLTGYVLGYVIALICRLDHKCGRTISMETGCQNMQLSMAILKVAFPPEVIGVMYIFPLIYTMLQVSEALLLALCIRCYQALKPAAKEKCTRVFMRRQK
ncbi:sodium/bile acid cotransporter-like isoform X2 [Thalassophryne amazonica]|uniref:sodium/bile acid cotransporter-like isoform X2 n=1 Tax=Thalassophryne amazonica TaxID=390379 RepID=UPI001471D7EE|nr:sodium/bile acid cotransporter-like isoform X2 [Thalassophryne amazonica]